MIRFCKLIKLQLIKNQRTFNIIYNFKITFNFDTYLIMIFVFIIDLKKYNIILNMF